MYTIITLSVGVNFVIQSEMVWLKIVGKKLLKFSAWSGMFHPLEHPCYV